MPAPIQLAPARPTLRRGWLKSGWATDFGPSRGSRPERGTGDAPAPAA
eukprot:CAMPEP_0176149008 /NCGR_PEP_ID=MMETSP0120_2-20121206/76010_1 /TAXON_ID=160619 /ORGANISM="Kryptoperidinium foliaceum, Strain CCMP 1326" /LENGTH=47 /DNA_ID= /DNA_START= /DNA_END= /DNA_ORIENTATION=